jgi:hypothetical protein
MPSRAREGTDNEMVFRWLTVDPDDELFERDTSKRGSRAELYRALLQLGKKIA